MRERALRLAAASTIFTPPGHDPALRTAAAPSIPYARTSVLLIGTMFLEDSLISDIQVLDCMLQNTGKNSTLNEGCESRHEGECELRVGNSVRAEALY